MFLSKSLSKATLILMFLLSFSFLIRPSLAKICCAPLGGGGCGADDNICVSTAICAVEPGTNCGTTCLLSRECHAATTTVTTTTSSTTTTVVSIRINMTLNGTQGNYYYLNTSFANITIFSNVTALVNLTANITGWTRISQMTPWSTFPNINCTANNTYYNFTASVGNSSYTGSPLTWYGICYNFTQKLANIVLSFNDTSPMTQGKALNISCYDPAIVSHPQKNSFSRPLQYSENFNLIFDNGLKINTADSSGSFNILLKPFIETTTGVRTYLTTPDSFPFTKDSNAGYTYSIKSTIPSQVKYIGFEFSPSKSIYTIIKESDKKIEFHGKDSEIILYFNDVPYDIAYAKNEVKINVQGLPSINIDPTINFTSNEITSPSISPLDNHTFALGYCDNSQMDISFKIYDTNGTNITNEIDVGHGVTSCDRDFVSTAPLNSTHFIIFYLNTTEGHVKFAIYNRNGNVVVPPTDVEIYAGSVSTVSVASLNSTHFIVSWVNHTNTNIAFAMFDSSGNLVGNKVNVTSFVSSAVVSVSAFNSTHFVIGWYDNNYPSRQLFAIYNTFTLVKSGYVTSAGLSANARVSALNSTHFVYSYYDQGNNYANFTVNDTSNSWAGLQPHISVGKNVGSSYVTTVSAMNSSYFVYGFYNQTETKHYYAIYKSDGTQILQPTVASNSAVSNGNSIMSSITNLNIGFCNQNFVYAYVVSSTQANFTTYYANGTIWNGICPLVEKSNPTFNNVKLYRNGTDVNSTENMNASFIPPAGTWLYECNLTDTQNYTGTNQSILFTVTDTTPPTYNSVGTNNTNPLPLEQVLFYSNWTDNVGLSHWIFSWNATGLTCGVWANDTAVAFTGSWANVTHQVPLACTGQTVDYEFYANDTSNNWNSTILNAFLEGTSNTCIPTANQNWNVNCADNCVETNGVINVSILNLYGTGTFTANNYNISMWKRIQSINCKLIRSNLRWEVYR